MTTISRLVRSLLLFALTILLVWGCNRTLSTTPHLTSEPIQPIQPAANCQSIEHAAGSTKICRQPQKIAVLSPYLLDILLSLGEQPAGYAGTSIGQGQFDHPAHQIPYLGNRIITQPMNLGDRTYPSLEALASLKPDLILGELWQGSQGKYDLFSQIAPTILIDDQQGGWQSNLQLIAKAMGRLDVIQPLMFAREQRMSAARQQLNAIVQANPRILLLSSGDLANGFYAYGQDRSVYSDLLEALGFKMTRLNDSMLEAIGAAPLSLEMLPQLDTDMLIVLGWDSNPNQNSLAWKRLQQKWNQTRLLKALPVSQAGRVYFMDGHLTMLRGPIAEAYILNDLLKQLTSKM
ncbi:periplasmic binding protein (plasmid) [Leptolyngbya boryana NIES-2135]|jgi:iron complex transport system substrate-binding protein|uniref:Periplasmic binding protein n=1 Tax=Leptolyngbya boryana NIES-2135 TaxID=1973484 RepID=A0A1Z4JSP6_LEPBY|nr:MULTISPECIES: iron-siderophore ABC transporter substrate-binding protein [Leptolyngbya]BAY59700.1 periplasmic binding protein [Leptolyngbya boryana NIES-2135]MBD2370866.1 iron-siderophore ABC transporter substrate-binding protein [Leptolyngbya sp. FACHB-161]MBD2377288.1 iron-siderophore ABC transporter substrate-binding protein [Leptolyngbya sp. FACHB-238]MBD2401750.1 iron-siderophore ABC transporter substrate-binding protein [Leptolyngbya sp. FACHB-239]MBD2408217.1 iron-siderophore ABC tra